MRKKINRALGKKLGQKIIFIGQFRLLQDQPELIVLPPGSFPSFAYLLTVQGSYVTYIYNGVSVATGWNDQSLIHVVHGKRDGCYLLQFGGWKKYRTISTPLPFTNTDWQKILAPNEKVE